MRAVVQRVTRASVRVGDDEVGAIGVGLVVLVGVGVDDAEPDARWLADKVRTLRIFRDADGVMNRSVEETGGSVLAVSQFTLHGDARRGRRPSYVAAAPPERAEPLYATFVALLRAAGVPVAEGRFQAMMLVELVNDGPVTILLDSKKAF
jgi:D-tyrosyl-tRNA(Tyr) deacylase